MKKKKKGNQKLGVLHLEETRVIWQNSKQKERLDVCRGGRQQEERRERGLSQYEGARKRIIGQQYHYEVC